MPQDDGLSHTEETAGGKQPWRWIARSLRQHPLIALPVLWVIATVVYYVALSLIGPDAPPKPWHLWRLVIFAPAGFPAVLSGFLLCFGALKEAESLVDKAALVAILALECIALPFLILQGFAASYFILCAFFHGCI